MQSNARRRLVPAESTTGSPGNLQNFLKLGRVDPCITAAVPTHKADRNMQQGGSTMKTLIATVILFGLGSGMALAEGDSGGLYAFKTMRQVQTGSTAVRITQNGEERFLGR
jgi:hypothetical protein